MKMYKIDDFHLGVGVNNFILDCQMDEHLKEFIENDTKKELKWMIKYLPTKQVYGKLLFSMNSYIDKVVEEQKQDLSDDDKKEKKNQLYKSIKKYLDEELFIEWVDDETN